MTTENNENVSEFSERGIKIEQVSPVGGALAGGLSITISGSGFQKDAIVYFGSQPAEKTVFESKNTLTATVPAANEPSSVAVTVVNPDGSQFTRVGGFTYISMENADRAEVSGVSPLTVIEGVETVITLRGRNLILAYDEGLIALRTPSRASVEIIKVNTGSEDGGDIEFVKFQAIITASPALEPLERIAVQVLASKSPEARENLMVESSKQMFTVLPGTIPVPLAYTPSLSSDKPTMMVVLGRNLEGCSLEFEGGGAAVNLQKGDERSLFGMVTVFDDPSEIVFEEASENKSSKKVSLMDSEGKKIAEYVLALANSSELKKSDPIVEEKRLLYEGASTIKEAKPTVGFTLDVVAVPDQLFLGPTAEDSSVYDLRGERSGISSFDLTFYFEIVIADFYIILPIVNEVYMYSILDGGGEEAGSPIVARIGELFPVRGMGILFAARVQVTLHVTIVLIVGIIIYPPWDYPFFNEFPTEFPSAIGIIILGIIIYVEVLIDISFLAALVLPDGSLRIIFLFQLVIDIDFTISADRRRLHFEANYDHSVNFYSILPFTNDPMPCGGRFQLASDGGQTAFQDIYGGWRAFYFAHSPGQCCVSWNFNLELLRFDSSGNGEVIQGGFEPNMCITAQDNPNLINIIITSLPPPEGTPPTLEMNLSEIAQIIAMAQPVDATGAPNGPLQDVRDLGYDPEFYLELPSEELDPFLLLDGTAVATQEGENIIHASLAPTQQGLPLYTFWSGAILGFDIIRYLAQGEEPRVISASLPVDVEALASVIKVEPVLAYKETQGQQTVLKAAPAIANVAGGAWEMERYEPHENQLEYVLAVKVTIPPILHRQLPITLKFTVNAADVKLYADGSSSPSSEAPLTKFVGRQSSDPKEFFTGTLVNPPANTTFDLVITSNILLDVLFEVPNLKILPNVKEESGTPRKLVPQGKNVTGKNLLLNIPLTCVLSDPSIASISLVKPALKAVVRNDETFEEYLRVFRQVQPILDGAGTYFKNFAETLFNALVNHGATSIGDVLKQQGTELWTKAVELVQGGYLEDRALYWTRLRGLAAARAFAKRKTQPLGADVKKFEWTSRGLDADDSGIKFTGTIPAAARRAIVTGFDPYQLTEGTYGANDWVEQSNPSSLIALLFDKKPVDVPNQGIVYVRTAIFPVRFKDFNDGLVENAVSASMNSIIMLITTSQNGGYNYYDVERWAVRRRAISTDNNNVSSVPSIIPNGEEHQESTLPYDLVITASEMLEGPKGPAAFVMDQSYKTAAAPANRDRFERRDAITPPTTPPVIVNGKFRPCPIVSDLDGHKKVTTDAPTGTSEEGSGENFLSNEIFYRVSLKRKMQRRNLATGHIHVPPTDFNPRGQGVGDQLKVGMTKALERFFTHGFHFTSPTPIAFPLTVINTNAERTMIVTNNSTDPLTVNTIDITAPFFVTPSSPLPLTINAGDSSPLTVRFSPTGIGAQTATVTLKETSGEILFIADMSGSGIDYQPPPVISSFQPHVVQMGDTVTVTGQYFTTTTLVKVGNLEVGYSLTNDNELIIFTDGFAGRLAEDYSIEDENAVPPNGTGWITGYVKVTTAFGTATSSTTLRIVFNY